MDVNLRGVMLSSQLVLPDMVERCRGRIINITSRAGAHRWPLVSAYSVSKAAVIKLTENLAHETARFGVGVFSVHPGLLPIGMSTSVTGAEPTNRYERKVQEWTLGELREGRGADPRDAVDLIVRIASVVPIPCPAATSPCTTILTPCSLAKPRSVAATCM